MEDRFTRMNIRVMFLLEAQIIHQIQADRKLKSKDIPAGQIVLILGKLQVINITLNKDMLTVTLTMRASKKFPQRLVLQGAG